jgi:hypothetical protein
MVRETERTNALIARIREVNNEADELFDKVEALEKEKKSRDWHIVLLKDEIEARKEWPRGKPPGYMSREAIRAHMERKVPELIQKAHEARMARHREWVYNSPFEVKQREIAANIAKDPDHYRKIRAAEEKRKQALWEQRKPEWNRLSGDTVLKIKAAMARAEAAGKPIEKLTGSMVIKISQGKLWPPAPGERY